MSTQVILLSHQFPKCFIKRWGVVVTKKYHDNMVFERGLTQALSFYKRIYGGKT